MKANRYPDYPVTVRKLSEEEGGGYLAEYPDIPGCMSDGETPEEAVTNARDALKAALETMKEFGDAWPKAETGGVWRQRAPKTLHQRLMAAAAREGVSFNTFVISLLAEGLGKRMIEPQFAAATKARSAASGHAARKARKH
jgi:antitoxin HicB